MSHQHALLSETAIKTLHEAHSFISEVLAKRLQALVVSGKPDDVWEAVTAVVYLTSSAASPHHAGRDSRARSFQLSTWNSAGKQRQRIEDMVESGFYYVGASFEDHVKCFFCDLGLKDWDAGDVPELEHVRYSPLCFFLKSSRSLAWITAHSTRPPSFPVSYSRQDHNRLLEILCQEFASSKGVIAASVGNNRTAVLLQIARSFIRRKEKLTPNALVMELQKELDRDMSVAADKPWFPKEFDLATVADEFYALLVRKSG